MGEQITETKIIATTLTTTTNTDCNNQVVVVEKPKSTDVLCGRGKVCFDHKGNDKFRELIAKYANPYQKATTKKAKMQVIMNVVNVVISNEGRFLMKNKEEVDQPWIDGGIKQGKKKTGHALRDALRGRVKCITKKMMMGKQIASTIPNPRNINKGNNNNHYHAPLHRQHIPSCGSPQHQLLPPKQINIPPPALTPRFGRHYHHRSHYPMPPRNNMRPVACMSAAVSEDSCSSYHSFSSSGSFSPEQPKKYGKNSISMVNRFLPPPPPLQTKLEPEREWENSILDNEVAKELVNFFKY